MFVNKTSQDEYYSYLISAADLLILETRKIEMKSTLILERV